MSIPKLKFFEKFFFGGKIRGEKWGEKGLYISLYKGFTGQKGGNQERDILKIWWGWDVIGGEK